MPKLTTAISTSFFLFILWVIYLANNGSDSLFFDFVKSIPYGDKIGHFFLFGTLTLTVVVASRFRSFTVGWLNIYYGGVLVALFVLGEEISQAFIPFRTFDLADLTADTLGILMAIGAAYLTRKYLIKIYDKDSVS
ncbi:MULTISPECIES: VanZ family protein [unclassified Microbulbifer]|uniref:VanZ family protein n=1 Tax=unclassified Microbulbifer TaxID=2619833 RepID=UPI0027E441C9|nr:MULTISPECIES: VanZ family protein [unclassified Microbulbifer]